MQPSSRVPTFLSLRGNVETRDLLRFTELSSLFFSKQKDVYKDEISPAGTRELVFSPDNNEIAVFSS
jgi:hypothetical protein